ncbi:methyltransferase [Rubripirellula amarantea]|nr:methyltransferase [Rubripirellula amarantea]
MSPHPLASVPTSDPSIALRYRDRQYAADLIAAALLHFDLFTYLRDHPGLTFDAICKHFEWQQRPADVLMTLCRASDFVRTDEAGVYSLTDAGREQLCVGSPYYLGPYYKPIADSAIMKGFVEILQTGKPANWQAKSDGKDWHESMKDPTFAQDFTALMNCRGIAFGQHLAQSLAAEVADRTHLLDVGGGSGIYCTTMVSRHSHLRATVLEQPPVDQIATQQIAAHGLADRVDVVSGDMFAGPWPSGVDMILLSNLLHDWGLEKAQQIVDKAAETLPVGGLLVIHGAIVNADKTGPLPVAEYSALLMNITQGKCYSEREYGDMCRTAGLTPGACKPTTGDRGYLTAVKTA